MTQERAARRVGSYLRSVRQRRGLTLQQVAHDLGWTVNQVQRVEVEVKKMPEPEILESLCDYYGITVYEAMVAAGYRLNRAAARTAV
jgi:HTH-type transcriptional regulator, competence development regulator